MQIRDLVKNKEMFEGKSKVFVMCRRGNASKEATELLLNELNLKTAINVEGGIEAIKSEIDPSLPSY